MTDNTNENREIKHRKTGETLRNAIFQAAWDELHDTGYLGFKMDSVAARCQTSKAVLYRHYETKENLVVETIKWRLPKELHYPLPNNGNLRDDLLEFLGVMSKFITPSRSQVALLFMNHNHENLTEKLPYVDFDGLSAVEALYKILENALERNDFATIEIPRAIVLMPLNALRNRALTANTQPVAEHILEIVDALYLPLIDFHCNQRQVDPKFIGA